MSTTYERPSTLRTGQGHESGKVGFVELFFDLVYVFAITQLSHSLLHHFNKVGLAETAFLMVAVWWVWVYTTWAMNWLNPAATSVRLMLFSQMFAGLILAVAIPYAFNTGGFAFAGAYVFMQVSRSLFTAWALRSDPGHFRNFIRISLWLMASGVFWVAGAFLEHEARWIVWGIALLIEIAGPYAFYWTPGLGASTTGDWDIRGEHMAERCGLLMIIALGESLLVTGATFAEQTLSLIPIAGLVTAFVGTVAMWWVYFNIGAERAAHRIAQAEDPGQLGRLAYTYLHIPIIAGILLTAVSDEIVLLHPMGHHGATAPLEGLALLGGPALFLVGNLFFKKAVFGKFARSHIAGIVMLAAAAFAMPVAGPLALGLFATVVMVIVGAWEHMAVNRRKSVAG
jgi:low temperature requirement protein LtrA